MPETGAFNEEEKLLCAELVQKGFIEIKAEKIYPRFCVFEKEEYRKLVRVVFEPLEKAIDGELESLQSDFQAYFKGKMPPQLRDYEMLCVNRAMCDMAFFCTVEAFKSGRLYVPESKADGEFLTLMYIKGEF